jgi:CheY-like chemotaxis protein/anti-sigma regulatory factor (Ser/Thr protein kinase)
MVKLVKNLLSLARQNPAETLPLDLNTLLREEIRLLEFTTLAGVRLVVELADELRLIRGDASSLAHAFMNLCVNAVDAMPDKGTLTLRTRNLDEDWVEVVVEDTGIGMSKEVLEKACDPFYTTKEIGKGTGLGLSMVYATVKGHLGHLEIQSQPGHGTWVRLRFPACETMLPEPAAPPGAVSARQALVVLVVDDDELIQVSMQAVLGSLGHTAVMARSGEEALGRLESGLGPDLVILDMNMPGLGGGGTLPLLRVLLPTVPILLATGRADQAALDLVEASPRVTLLPKPFTLDELKQCIDSLALIYSD